MSDLYILDGKTPKPVPDIRTWGKFFKAQDRTVAKTTIGDSRVSTVFLGLDHQYGDGPPLLFETMVFGGTLDEEQDRCSTWNEAVRMHDTMCRRVHEAESGE